MGKLGMILIWSLVVMVVLAIMLNSFFMETINENNLVKRYAASVRAFWLAEAGIAETIVNMPNGTSGTVGSGNYRYTTTVSPLAVDNYYRIDSKGIVTLPDLAASAVTRLVSAVVRTESISSSNFQHAIRTTVNLDVHGSVEINGTVEENAPLDFPDLFGQTKEEVKSCATHLYTELDNNPLPVEGITWVELPKGEELRISFSDWEGEGIFVIVGDVRISGGTFNGILYVIGELRVSGNPTINGTILVESSTELVDDTIITGNPTINYNPSSITAALDPLEFISSEVVSWQQE